MKFITLILASFLSIALQAQEKHPTGKLLVGFNFSPDYSSRTLDNNDGSPNTSVIIKNRNRIERPKFGYTTGVNVAFHISQHLALQTGLQYSNKGYRITKHELFFSQPGPGQPTSVQSTYAYSYIGVPLTVKLSFGSDNIRFQASMGMMANGLLNGKYTATNEYSDGSTRKKSASFTSEIKKIDLSPMVGLGLDYKISDKTRLLFEPAFRYGLLKTTDTPVQETLWSAGLNLGVWYIL